MLVIQLIIYLNPDLLEDKNKSTSIVLLIEENLKQFINWIPRDITLFSEHYLPSSYSLDDDTKEYNTIDNNS